MKKLFSVLAIMLMALTAAAANHSGFYPDNFSGSGTKTITATYNDITLTIVNSTSDIITQDKWDFMFGSGTITITATGTNVNVTGISLFYDGQLILSDTGAGPWEYDVTNNKINGSGVNQITIYYSIEQQAAEKPAAPTFGTEPGKYLTRVDVEINRPYEGADVYYTTNGSTPTALSEILNPKGYATIDKEGKSTIKAVTIKDGVASDVASLEIEIIKPKLSVTNIDEKYEGWTACVIDYDNNTDDLLSSAQQSIMIFTQDFALQFSNSDTWEEHYAKMTAGGEYVTVKDNKFEISYVSTTDAESCFAIAFFEDGMTCGSKFEMRDTHEITIDDQGVFNVNEFHPNPIIIGTLRSDNEETAVSEEEKALAALMGKTVYAMDDNGMFTRLFINSKGQLTTTIVASNTNITMPIASMCSFTKDGNNYIATSSMGGDNSYTFVVEDGKVTKIDYYEEGTFVQSLLPSAEYTLAALMGSSEYTDGNRTFLVNNDGKIEDVRNETFILSLDYTFSLKADGNYELTGKYEDCKYDNLIFYVVNQKVTKIEYYFKDKLTATYLPPAEDVLVALMGDVKYVSGYYIVSVNEDGDIIFENTVQKFKNNISESFSISLEADGNYITDIYFDVRFVFYVEDQKVTKIEAYNPQELYVTFLPEQETPTAITAPAAEKGVKAVKVIENGEIVIIKNGERFNLRGAKIK